MLFYVVCVIIFDIALYHIGYWVAGTDFRDGNESLTDSGYPRVMREWRRGTDLLTDSCVVYSGDKADVSVYMYIAKHRHHRCVRCTCTGICARKVHFFCRLLVWFVLCRMLFLFFC
jgi:hypothetical protein